MHVVSRRALTFAVCGLPFVTLRTGAARPSGWNSQQRDTAERTLRRLVDTGAVPGISYSVGNSEEALAQGAFGLRTVAPPNGCACRDTLRACVRQQAIR
jgi:hypothetical protein